MFKITAFFLFALLITACSPKFDWRDVRGKESPFVALMPDKPVHLSREIQLGEQTVIMHMTVAQIDGVNFAIGAAKMPTITAAQEAITQIKKALINNIAGVITHERSAVTTNNANLTFSTEFDAISTARATGSPATRVVGRVVARSVWVFEVVVMGPENNISNDAVDIFLSSFKPT